MTEPLSKYASSKLRTAGAFVLAGLVVEALSLWWNHPLAFLAFLAVGGLLLAIGIVIYLLTLLKLSRNEPPISASPSISASSVTRQV